MTKNRITLYDLLPEFYKQLDVRTKKAFDKLPEVYRSKLGESSEPYQLRAFLNLIEGVMRRIHDDIESLYHNFFIETCEPFLIPYIGDLIGVSHLKGDSVILRPDIADSVYLLRRKGTLGALEQLVFDLTTWGVYCLELKEKMLINQNINLFGDITLHQEIMSSQLSSRGDNYFKNCLVEVRDPSFLELMKTPFDPFAHVADLKPIMVNKLRYNIPNLAIFLWRLKTYQLIGIRPEFRDGDPKSIPGSSGYLVGFDVHPLNRIVRLFNYSESRKSVKSHTEWNEDSRISQHLTQIDETPGKILRGRLMEDTGNPSKYLKVIQFDNLSDILRTTAGLTLYIPSGHDWDDWPSIRTTSVNLKWKIRGEDLTEWEKCVMPPLKNQEIAIDPKLGRILIRVEKKGEADALKEEMHVNYTYGISGDVGAHPSVRHKDSRWDDSDYYQISGGGDKLDDKIKQLYRSDTHPNKVTIEIQDSLAYKLNFTDIELLKSLYIRAGEDQRPIILLADPLQFSPVMENSNSRGSSDDDDGEITLDQGAIPDPVKNLIVRFEGMFLSRATGLAQKDPLFTRVALNSLELSHCTLDPGGFKRISKRAPIAKSFPSMKLDRRHGFASDAEAELFREIPEILLENCICGALHVADTYNLFLRNTIIDAGEGVDVETPEVDAIGPPEDSDYPWGPPMFFESITVFGITKVKHIKGTGAIFVQPIQVFDIMKGCIQNSYITGERGEMPQKEKCVQSTEAFPKLRFVSERFGDPSYAQLEYKIDKRIKENGPNNNAMGAFGFLREEDKWRNLTIRFREFMPVGIRPILIVQT